jgi:hypothetical protein
MNKKKKKAMHDCASAHWRNIKGAELIIAWKTKKKKMIRSEVE